MSLFSKPKNGNGSSGSIIELTEVHKYYKTAVGDYHALNSIDLHIEAGEFVSIIGKSGSGKSTLLNMITGIDHPTSGQVFVNGTGVHELNENRMARWRGKNLGIVFQFFQLLPTISVIENIMLPMDFCRTYPMREREKRALDLLEMVELADHAYKLPTALSGGQQQRVAIARALANDPPIVIADEPTGNLDSKTAESVFALFNDLVSKGKTIIIVTHDSGLAKRTHRTALITDGEIVNEYVAKAMPTLLQDQMLWATRNAKVMTYEAGTMIVSEGTHADTFYVVSKGTVEVVLPRADQSDVIAMQLGPGKFFGELAFFRDRKRQASVRASEHGAVEVLALSYDQLNELLGQSEATNDWLRQIADRNAAAKHGVARSSIMSSRWKKVWADFWGNKSRTFLIILTIAVGVLAVGFNSNMGLYMNESMDADYLSASPSEATVYAGPLNDEMVKIAREVPGVDAVEGRSSTSAQVVRTDDKKVSIQFTAVEDPSKSTLNQLKPAQGETSLPPLGEKQIIVDASVMSLGYKVGDVITVELGNGRHRELTLAGYMHDVTGFPFAFTTTMNAYVTPKTLEWLGGRAGSYDYLAVSVAEKQTDANHVTTVAQAVADRVERAGATIYFVSVYQPGHHFAYSITQGIFFILLVLGYMTVLLSGFLIINTITALMTQQTRQIGIMKAVGGGNSQIAGMYLVLILGFGLAAFAIGYPLANAAAKAVGGGMAQYLNFYPLPYGGGYRAALIQQLIAALLVPLLAALWPIYNSVRVTVREAISDYGIGGNARPKDKAVAKGALLLSRPMRLSLRNAFRKKTRLILTLFTLVLGGAIFIGVYNLWASFAKTIEDIQGYFLADINMSFGRNYRFDEVAAIAESIPGVSSVEGWVEYPGTLISDNKEEAGTQILFVAPPSTSTLIDPLITSGRWLATGDENAIVIGNHLLNIFPDLKVGDWLTIKVDEKEIKWHIVGTYSITGNVSPPLLYVNYEYLSQLIGQPGQVYSVRVLTEQHDVVSQRRIGDQLQKLYESHGINIGSTQLGAEFIRDQKSQTDILVYFMLGMAGMIAIVGGLGLMGTMSINVLERTREIGVMRAVGASNADIQGIVIVEGLVVGLISWAISILVAIPITGILCFGVGMAILTAPMPAVYGVTGIVAWLIFTLVLATIASALPARRASRLTVRDTLAYE